MKILELFNTNLVDLLDIRSNEEKKSSMNANFYWRVLNRVEDTIEVMCQNKEKIELVAIKSM
jgi:hypothetical protein